MLSKTHKLLMILGVVIPVTVLVPFAIFLLLASTLQLFMMQWQAAVMWMIAFAGLSGAFSVWSLVVFNTKVAGRKSLFLYVLSLSLMMLALSWCSYTYLVFGLDQAELSLGVFLILTILLTLQFTIRLAHKGIARQVDQA